MMELNCNAVLAAVRLTGGICSNDVLCRADTRVLKH